MSYKVQKCNELGQQLINASSKLIPKNHYSTKPQIFNKHATNKNKGNKRFIQSTLKRKREKVSFWI